MKIGPERAGTAPACAGETQALDSPNCRRDGALFRGMRQMIFVAIGDIRGNMSALQCVLDLVMHEGIQTIVNTGDSVVGHSGSHEVIEVLRRESIASVQGERDRWLARFGRKHDSLRERLPEVDFKALERAYELCSSLDLEYLASLPSRLSLAVDGVSIEVCHGTLTGPANALGPRVDAALFQR